MPLPKDFDRDLWLDPLEFEGLVGAALAHGLYSELFRADGFAKPLADLLADPRLKKLLTRASLKQPDRAIAPLPKAKG